MTSEELAIFKIKEIMSWDLEDIKEYWILNKKEKVQFLTSSVPLHWPHSVHAYTYYWVK
jgi:hypothetical protein